MVFHKKMFVHLVSSILFLPLFCMVVCSCSNNNKIPEGNKKPEIHKDKNTELMGAWFKVKKGKERLVGDKKEIEKNLNQLQSLGYLSGYKKAPISSGTTTYKKDLAFNGINLYVSGHQPYAALLDMQGKILHSWSFSYSLLADNLKAENEINTSNILIGNNIHTNSEHFWRRVYAYENGDVLAIYDYIGLVKINKDSELIWYYPGRVHHDLFVSPLGDIWVLTASPGVYDGSKGKFPIVEDFITQLNSKGKVVSSVSIVKCFQNSEYNGFLNKLHKNEENGSSLTDIFHTNTISVLDGKIEGLNTAFKKGNVLISIRELSLVAVVNLNTQRIAWVMKGQWKRQHEPQILSNGNILLFDNWGGKTYSRILEINPKSKKLVWQYKPEPLEKLQSPICGSQQRLPNSNTLITDTCGGKAFEVTQQGQVVWEYVNPHRAGSNDELVAAIFELLRLPANYFSSWLNTK